MNTRRPDTSMVTLARLRPAFKEDGTLTAGDLPAINDGAAARLRWVIRWA